MSYLDEPWEVRQHESLGPCIFAKSGPMGSKPGAIQSPILYPGRTQQMTAGEKRRILGHVVQLHNDQVV